MAERSAVASDYDSLTSAGAYADEGRCHGFGQASGICDTPS
jgi:hypothetical protein